MPYTTSNPLKMKGSIVLIQGKVGFMLEGSHKILYPMYKHIHENHPELYLYDLRHSETDWSRPYWLEEGGSILVNYFGIVIMRKPIKFAKGRNDFTVRNNGRTCDLFSYPDITFKDFIERQYEVRYEEDV